MKNEDIKILTEREKLVPVSPKYARDIYGSFTAEVTTFMFPKPADSIEETQDFIKNSVDEMKKGQSLQLVILTQNSGVFLGCVGLHNIDKPDPEIGVWVKTEAHGNGYGKEAVGGLIEWAKEHLDFDYFRYPVDKRNTSSRKIAESFGGIVKKEFTSTGLAGNKLDQVEYWIYV